MFFFSTNSTIKIHANKNKELMLLKPTLIFLTLVLTSFPKARMTN